jgi:hypothetical protein
MITSAAPASAAATACPPHDFVGNTNLSRNPSFEFVGPNGSPRSWQLGDPTPSQSAGRFWLDAHRQRGSPSCL